MCQDGIRWKYQIICNLCEFFKLMVENNNTPSYTSLNNIIASQKVIISAE